MSNIFLFRIVFYILHVLFLITFLSIRLIFHINHLNFHLKRYKFTLHISMLNCIELNSPLQEFRTLRIQFTTIQNRILLLLAMLLILKLCAQISHMTRIFLHVWNHVSSPMCLWILVCCSWSLHVFSRVLRF